MKGRGCASALHVFKRITHRRDVWTKQVLRLKSWVIVGSSDQWMEFLRFCWTVCLSFFLFGFLFSLFHFYCLLVQCSIDFFKHYNFCFSSYLKTRKRENLVNYFNVKQHSQKQPNPQPILIHCRNSLYRYIGEHPTQFPVSTIYFKTWTGRLQVLS